MDTEGMWVVGNQVLKQRHRSGQPTQGVKWDTLRTPMFSRLPSGLSAAAIRMDIKSSVEIMAVLLKHITGGVRYPSSFKKHRLINNCRELRKRIEEHTKLGIVP